MSRCFVVVVVVVAAVDIFAVFVVCLFVCVSVCLSLTPDVPNDRSVIINFRDMHSRKSEITHPRTQHPIQEDPNFNE
jgi:hypothetical protein